MTRNLIERYLVTGRDPNGYVREFLEKSLDRSSLIKKIGGFLSLMKRGYNPFSTKISSVEGMIILEINPGAKGIYDLKDRTISLSAKSKKSLEKAARGIFYKEK